jgi:thiamine-monophosphate kinase
MDISDGLAKDLGRMCKASGCAAHVRFGDIPLSAAAARALAADPGLAIRVVAGGDDYEILAPVPAVQASAFVAAAARAGIPVAAIGSLAEGEGVVIAAADGRPMPLPSTGWDHFRAR